MTILLIIVMFIVYVLFSSFRKMRFVEKALSKRFELYQILLSMNEDAREQVFFEVVIQKEMLFEAPSPVLIKEFFNENERIRNFFNFIDLFNIFYRRGDSVSKTAMLIWLITLSDAVSYNEKMALWGMIDAVAFCSFDYIDSEFNKYVARRHSRGLYIGLFLYPSAEEISRIPMEVDLFLKYRFGRYLSEYDHL